MLQGFRGRSAADLDALADTPVRVSHLAIHLEGHLAELDINTRIHQGGRATPIWYNGVMNPRR